ncbi:hypothetical protein KCMC57_up35810 [Kitasatospora sp. CMC57]|uniref:Uncharacterized protein n=1 Tax=Kitasatospora sp. CMC57 TaxID=3231513 RepID=A0AB33K0R4_9ACTN
MPDPEGVVGPADLGVQRLEQLGGAAAGDRPGPVQDFALDQALDPGPVRLDGDLPVGADLVGEADQPVGGVLVQLGHGGGQWAGEQLQVGPDGLRRGGREGGQLVLQDRGLRLRDGREEARDVQGGDRHQGEQQREVHRREGGPGVPGPAEVQRFAARVLEGLDAGDHLPERGVAEPGSGQVLGGEPQGEHGPPPDDSSRMKSVGGPGMRWQGRSRDRHVFQQTGPRPG